MNFLNRISSQYYINLNFKLYNKKYRYLIKLITVLLLIYLPYVCTITLIALVFFIQITLVIVLNNLYSIKLLNSYKQILLFSLSTMFFNYFVNYNNIHTISVYILFFPKITLLLFNRKLIYKLSIYYIVYQIPEYIKRIIILNILYFIIYYNISIFIKSETINKFLYIGYRFMDKLKVNLYNIVIVNILISNQVLEKIIERVNSICLAIQIRSTYNKKEIIKYIFFYNHKLFNQMLKDQNNLNITLWNRSIDNKFKNKIYID
uniref:hypothetical protein orf261 n=1 Tax=Symphyocladia marchantioides TaxID=88360 RepID=UPI0022FD942C|nr:hypothetical protein orf261 [Symphyocladia marchantioides]WAX03857.1 hypothetical protein orf261 [Symphyocladia marchantioides]